MAPKRNAQARYPACCPRVLALQIPAAPILSRPQCASGATLSNVGGVLVCSSASSNLPPGSWQQSCAPISFQDVQPAPTEELRAYCGLNYENGTQKISVLNITDNWCQVNGVTNTVGDGRAGPPLVRVQQEHVATSGHITAVLLWTAWSRQCLDRQAGRHALMTISVCDTGWSIQLPDDPRTANHHRLGDWAAK